MTSSEPVRDSPGENAAPAPVSLVSKGGAAAGFATFMLLGALQAMYGPSIPALRGDFALSAPVAGLLLSAQFWGAVLGVVAFGATSAYLGSRTRLGVGTASVALGCGGVSAAVNWPMALAAALFAGFGSGALIVALNTAFATGFGNRSTAMVNLLNAAYGAGAVLGPLGIAITPGTSFRPGFAVTGITALLLLPFVSGIPERPAVRGAVSLPVGRWAILALGLFLLICVLYDGLESNIGGWAATQLKYNGHSGAFAAEITAAFWGALTIGRILLAPVTERFAPYRLLSMQFATVVVVMVVAHHAPFLPVSYIVAGFLFAPIFPVLFVWVQHSFPTVRSAPSFVLFAALLGGAAFPPLTGKLIGVTSPNVLPTVLAVIAVAAVICVGAAQRVSRRLVIE